MPRVLAALVLFLPLALAAQPGSEPDARAVMRSIVNQTNDFRRSQGLAPTTSNPQLAAAARDFARYMARSDRYGHEADGREPAQRAGAQGYAYCLVSENIAMQFSSAGFDTEELAQRLVEGWKQSPGHRRNMLDRDAVETGVAVARSPRSGRWYAVQMFGRPAALRTTFRIANRSSITLNYELGSETFQLPPHVSRTHEECHADVLAVHLPGQWQAQTAQPADGDHFAVERDGGRYRLLKG